MIPKSASVTRYGSALDRFLKPAIVNFFEREFTGMFGPIVRENIAGALVNLFNSLCPETSRLKPGQLVWTALDQKTRADSPKKRLKPIVLSLITQDEISRFIKNESIIKIRQGVMARMFKEAYEQGAVLSTRDMSLLLVSHAPDLSHLRINYEDENKTILPHTGNIHDVGTTLTHKKIIIYKHVVEKKDPFTVAKETKHSQKAVDRYLKDFYRVKTLVDDNKNLNFIHQTTNLSKPLINQYMQIINNYGRK
jgi:hypothetical protein